MNMKLGKTISTIFLLVSSHAFAAAYNTPSPNQAIIGQIQHYSVSEGATTADVAVRYDIGYNAIENANPQVNVAKRLASGTDLKIPTQHLLPDLPRKGIVINLPEMRMYYYVGEQVFTYPIGIGKIGKTIPIADKATITRKTINPIWIPPADIREWDLKEQGIVLPRIMPPGPDNPLGPYAIYTSLPTYLIHSTIFPESIGKRASFGCIRMYESDIKNFFPSITKGIPLAIINSPIKMGWQNDKLYMESHLPLEEHGTAYEASLSGTVHLVMTTTKNQPVLVNWQLVSYLAKTHDGIPHEIGMKIQ